MVNILIAFLYGTLAVLLPVISLGLWSVFLFRFFPYSRGEFQKVILFKGVDRSLRYIMTGMSAVYFMAASMISVGLALIGGYIFLIYLAMIDPSLSMIDPSLSPVSYTIVLMSAGPFEEGAKLLAAGLIYLTFHIIWKKVTRERRSKIERDKVKDGMIFGLFVGASFGFIESIMYLWQNFTLLGLWGFKFYTLDPLIWRFVLGVMIHALYTGIASAGLGSRTVRSKVMVTSFVLLISIVLHSLNNGIQGYIILILEMNNLKGWILTDILQGTFVLIGLGFFILLWKTSRKRR